MPPKTTIPVTMKRLSVVVGLGGSLSSSREQLEDCEVYVPSFRGSEIQPRRRHITSEDASSSIYGGVFGGIEIKN